MSGRGDSAKKGSEPLVFPPLVAPIRTLTRVTPHRNSRFPGGCHSEALAHALLSDFPICLLYQTMLAPFSPLLRAFTIKPDGIAPFRGPLRELFHRNFGVFPLPLLPPPSLLYQALRSSSSLLSSKLPNRDCGFTGAFTCGAFICATGRWACGARAAAKRLGAPPAAGVRGRS